MKKSVRTATRTISEKLQNLRWPLTACLAVVALALGWIGFTESTALVSPPPSPSTNLYRALQLFLLAGGEAPKVIPWQLEAARFLAPALTFLAGVLAALSFLGERLSALRARMSSDHVVVCGLGRLGAKAAASLHAAGYDVVAIEKDADNIAIKSLRNDGIIVIVGDATDPSVLKTAGVTRAKHLLAFTGDDNLNLNIASEAHRALTAFYDKKRQNLPSRSVPRTLTCFINLLDNALTGALNEFGMSIGEDGDFSLEAFNFTEFGARAILESHPPFKLVGKDTDKPPHPMIVGLGDMGRHLITDTARRWAEKWAEKEPKNLLEIEVVDLHATRRVKRLLERYPSLDKICRITPHDLDVLLPSTTLTEFLHDMADQANITVVYVSLANDVAGLNAAKILQSSYSGVEIIVRTMEGGGVAALLGGDPKHPVHPDITVIDMLDLVCDPDVLLKGQHEIIARAIHQNYRRSLGPDVQDNSSDVLWKQLDRKKQESNRGQAKSYVKQIRATGRRIEPLVDWSAPLFEFDNEEIERLAVMEHERWNREQQDDGWRLGPIKDPARKTTPYLVSYADLPEEIKDYDRKAMSAIPALLAKVGLTATKIRSFSKDQNELIARAIHAEYLDDYLRVRGRSSTDNPAAVPWEHLSESFRAANRDQAADYARKLRAIGCRIEPLADRNAPLLEFTDPEIERLAAMEHERWNRERLTDGWRLGPAKDLARKTTPYLVPYADLSEEVKDYDRRAMHNIPRILASIGLVVTRTGSDEAPRLRPQDVVVG